MTNALIRKLMEEAAACGLLSPRIVSGGKHDFLEATHPETGRPIRVVLSRGARATGSWRLEKKKICDLRRAVRHGGSFVTQRREP